MQLYEPTEFWHMPLYFAGIGDTFVNVWKILHEFWVMNIIWAIYWSISYMIYNRLQLNQNIIINFILYSNKTRRTVDFVLLKIIGYQITCTGSSITSKSFFARAIIWIDSIFTQCICVAGIGNTFVNFWKI